MAHETFVRILISCSVAVNASIHVQFHCLRSYGTRTLRNITVAVKTFKPGSYDVPLMREQNMLWNFIDLLPWNFLSSIHKVQKFLFLRRDVQNVLVTSLAHFNPRQTGSCRFVEELMADSTAYIILKMFLVIESDWLCPSTAVRKGKHNNHDSCQDRECYPTSMCDNIHMPFPTQRSRINDAIIFSPRNSHPPDPRRPSLPEIHPSAFRARF